MTALAFQTLYQIIIMLMIILVGMFCYKINLISKETNERLSNLVLMLINPIVIFVSYQREFDPTLLKGLMISLVLALITHIMAILIAYLLLRKNKQEADHAIERFAIVYSNCGFIGIPLVNGILGGIGVFYITAYMTIFNLFIWTHGVIIMTGKKDKKTLITAFRSPTIIATIFGFALFVARLPVPDLIVEALSYIGNMNTPLAMLVAGVTIAQMNLRKLFTKPYNYYISFIKLILVPLLMLFLYQFFDISRDVLLTTILATACPVGATISLFAIRYKKNYIYASELFALTTLLSVITIPIVMTIAGLLVN
ncbi:MAG: AEC family transporter [Clostridiales bacterium]|jgi:predicted permease|nr:AEC family transporter [Clostridiales bacterium]